MAKPLRLSAKVPFGPALAAIAVTTLAAGCTAVPSGGAPSAVKENTNQVQAYVMPQPPPPPTTNTQQWNPTNVVLGFLHASATYAVDPAAAEAYLAPNLRKTWHPGPVTVVKPPTEADFKPLSSHPGEPVTAGEPTQYETVQLTGQRLATLTSSGQYIYRPGSTVYNFTVALVHGVWQIYRLPQSLLLTQPDFEHVYQPRNLYFFAPQQASDPTGELVPDPVFAPIEGTSSALNTTVATGLVQGLFQDRNSWLSGATWTAFPAGTTLIGGQVTISGQTAEVNLGGAAAKVQAPQRQDMLDQLTATLTTRSGYSPPIVRYLQLEINGKPVYPGVRQNLVPDSDYWAGSEPVFLKTSLGAVAKRVPGPGGAGVVNTVQLPPSVSTAIAAAPGTDAIAVQAGDGCAVYLENGTRYHIYPLSRSGGPCVSLSWDNNGNLWAASAHHVWVLPGQSWQPTAVVPPRIPGARTLKYAILALRMAPDGVRAALLVRTAAGNRILLAAVRCGKGGPSASGFASTCSYAQNGASFGPTVFAASGLSDPQAVSWYNAYYLAVLDAGTIYQVPLTGGAGQSLGSAPAGAQTLTTNGTDLVVGTDRDQIMISPAGSISWTRFAVGTDPIYPG